LRLLPFFDRVSLAFPLLTLGGLPQFSVSTRIFPLSLGCTFCSNSGCCTLGWISCTVIRWVVFYWDIVFCTSPCRTYCSLLFIPLTSDFSNFPKKWLTSIAWPLPWRMNWLPYRMRFFHLILRILIVKLSAPNSEYVCGSALLFMNRSIETFLCIFFPAVFLSLHLVGGWVNSSNLLNLELFCWKIQMWVTSDLYPVWGHAVGFV